MTGEDSGRCNDDSCGNATVDSFQHDPHNAVGKAGAAVISIMISIGTVGNVVVLLAVAKCPKLQKSYNVIIAALAVTDLIFNTIIMPFYADTFLNRKWRFSAAFCRFNTFLGTMVVMASALHIGLIAVNRYVLIVFPHLYRHVAQRQAIACQIAFIWLLSFLTVLPGILGWNAVVEYSDQIGRCNYVRSESKTSLYFIFSIGFFLPCVIMTFAYVQIYLAIHRSGRSMLHHKSGTPMQGSGKRHSCSSVPLIPVQGKDRAVSVIRSNNDTGNTVCHGCHDKARNHSDSIQSRGTNRALAAGGREDAEEQNDPGNNNSVDNGKLYLLTFTTASRNRPASTEQLELTDLQQRQNQDASGHPSIHSHQQTSLSTSQHHTEAKCHSSLSLPCPRSSSTSERLHKRDVHSSTSERLHKRDVHIVHMIFVLFLAFALTYLPFTVLNTVDQAGEFGRNWYMLTSLAFWAGACINPWIYGIMNKQFREAYKAVLCNCRHRH